MNIECKLNVAEIQRFSMHDGPGVRTTVFLKGCPLRCAWCHNPETQDSAPQILFYPNKCVVCGRCAGICPTGAHAAGFNREKCVVCGACAEECPAGALEKIGGERTVREILAAVERDRAFYGEKGGVTVSGGEPLSQKNTVALLRACKERGLHTALDTCGYAGEEILCAALPFVDLFLWDIKDTDSARHKRFTGVSNEPILRNLRIACEAGARIRLRCILVNGVNTEEAHYTRIAALAKTVPNLDGLDLLPYHAYAGSKAAFLGLPDNGNPAWIPTEAELARARAFLPFSGK